MSVVRLDALCDVVSCSGHSVDGSKLAMFGSGSCCAAMMGCLLYRGQQGEKFENPNSKFHPAVLLGSTTKAVCILSCVKPAVWL